ncbi:MAG: hypothetical protein HFJ60_04845 [Clostridia bacterium]|jgi:uncharacterized protein (UPF0332 family)|nr:hypothetical protein [Clostridia bacterium]
MKKLIEKAFELAFGEDEKLKVTYNKILQRYYNGCNYIEEHLEEAKKYLPKVLELLDKLNKILEKIPNATEEEILYGFKT